MKNKDKQYIKTVEDLKKEGWIFVGFQIGEDSTWKPKNISIDFKGNVLYKKL